ncbi:MULTISPECIES: autotransporter assembly complex family protein [Gammaproteobacteria]|uniref:autotransporter assembly complex protein TamA n=1 Tax=Gammaproteobacteria TaxID=1236 RepID=UPI000DCF8877|nr:MULTISPECIES: autotransporter assembly complex family protein [Gammaproteobacteria]RTE85967.1 outer membrane protein assembly factor [Aliidiomarina sp. B3213]TCZ90034.1 outer membrane protein assembly factor [Lysobacter sp. N42]
MSRNGKRILQALSVTLFAMTLNVITPASAQTARTDTEQTAPMQMVVNIEGVDGEILTNVHQLLSIYQYHQQQAPGVSRIRFLHRRAEREIGSALAPFGYYQFDLTSSLQEQEQQWVAQYQITLNQRIPVGNIDVRILGPGANDPLFNNLIQQLPLSTGTPLRHQDYEDAKNQIRRIASEHGYYQARYDTNELRVNLDDYQAHIVLHLQTGERYRYGRVQISEGHLDEDVMQRFVAFREGDFIDSTELLELQLGLSDSDYFSRVEVQPLWNEATEQNRVPVRIDYEPNKRTYYQFGLGYGTDTGPRASFEQNRRWVNSRGHRLNGQIQASENRSSVGAGYIIPGEKPQTDQYVIRTLWTDENTDNAEFERLSFGLSWQRQLDRSQRIFAIDWQDERDSLDGIIRKTQYLIPSAQWTRTHTDNRLDVDEGFRTSLTLRGATEAILSDSDFLQLLVSAKWVTTFHEHTRLLLRSELGTSATSDFDQVPTSLRFYAGGDRSVRGYAYRAIGPRNDLNEVEGGRHLVVASAEIDYEFRPKWRLAAFIDAGNAFNDISDSMKVGVGFGVRWQTPIGPIRFDLASGLDDPGDSLRLHLVIGPDL